MAQNLEHSSRPTRTEDLIRLLTSSDCDPKETMALQALSRSMIRFFQDHRKLAYVPEAAELSSIATDENYQNLVVAFSNAIIKGTTDGDILDPKLLTNYAYVLHRARVILSAETAQLESVLDSLQKRLDSAKRRAEVETQYHLVCTLSTVLDAMVDIKISGLNREMLHEPLLKRLTALSTHRELRLAQAAGYAREALLGVPDDEGPYQALWRHMCAVAQGAAMVASAVPTMDPSRLIDAIPNLASLPDFLKSLGEVLKGLYDAYTGAQTIVGGMKTLSKQKGWYVALRYTDMMIQADALEMLQDFTQQGPYGKKELFWSGLYAQLEERALIAVDVSIKTQVVELLRRVLTKVESPSPRVLAWGRLVADSLERSDWKDALQHTQYKWRRCKNKKYKRTKNPVKSRANTGATSL